MASQARHSSVPTGTFGSEGSQGPGLGQPEPSDRTGRFAVPSGAGAERAEPILPPPGEVPNLRLTEEELRLSEMDLVPLPSAAPPPPPSALPSGRYRKGAHRGELPPPPPGAPRVRDYPAGRTRDSAEFLDLSDADLEAGVAALSTPPPAPQAPPPPSVELIPYGAPTPAPSARSRTWPWVIAVMVTAAGLWLSVGVLERKAAPAAGAANQTGQLDAPVLPAGAVSAVQSATAVDVPPDTPPAPAAPAMGHKPARVDKPATRRAAPSRKLAAESPRPTRQPELPLAEPAPETPTAPELPEGLSRSQVLAGFESVRAAVAACADGAFGVANVSTTIVGSGRVTHALVGGDFNGTPQGSCIARAVRKARFPAFSGEPLKVEFPFAF